MGASKELFLRMSEQEYMEIPEGVREAHLRHKIYNESVHDFTELIQDEHYAALYKKKKEVSKELDERQFQLRENKRKINNIEINE